MTLRKRRPIGGRRSKGKKEDTAIRLLSGGRYQLTEDLDTPLAGIVDLGWVGTIQPPLDPVVWQGITGLADIAVFDSD